MNKDGLQKIYLIKSAGYEFDEIDLKDNTLLLGESGIGKTTIMRAVLFFYTMDYSDSILKLNSNTKKPFNKWYFQEHNSYLVYEYQKNESTFLFVVSKTVQMRYLFIDITNTSFNVKNLFLENNKPITRDTLIEKIQKANLANYDTNQIEKYINTFHKRDINFKKIKQESIVDFSLFEDVKSTKEYGKTLSNIFMASKVNSTTIKKSIVSLVENSTVKIDLNEIKLNLDGYVEHKSKIEAFEKKIPDIKKLSLEYDNYSKNKKEFRLKANELETIKNQSSKKMQEFQIELEELKEKSNIASNKYKLEQSKLDDKLKNSSQIVIEQDKELRELNNKVEEYKSKNIIELLNEHRKEKEYNNQLRMTVDKYSALTSKFEDIKEKYRKIEEVLEKSYNENILELKNKNIETRDKLNQKRVDLLESKDKIIEEKTTKYKEDKLLLENNLKIVNSYFNNINVKLGEIKHFIFNTEEISKYKEYIDKYNKSIFDTQKLLTENSFKLQKVEQELEFITINFKSSSEKLVNKVKKKKDELFKQKDLVEKKLDFNSDNLYGYINKNSIKNSDKLFTYLKDDILFSDKKFTIKESDNSNTIFGLDISFNEEFQNSYKSVELQKELKLIKDSINQLNKDSAREKNILDKKATNATNEKNRERTKLYKVKDTEEENKKSYKNNKSLAKLDLQKAEEDAKKQKQAKKDELEQESILYKKEQKKLNSKIDDINHKIKDITQNITKDISNKKYKYDKELQESKIILISNIEILKNKYNAQIEANKKELNKTLENNGADNKLIKTILNDKKVLETKLKSIEKYRSLVIVYLTEYKEKIENIPSLKQKLEEDEKYLNNIKKEITEKENKFKVEEKKTTFKKEVLIIKQNKIRDFKKAYTKKIENQEIEIKIKEYLDFDSFILNDIEINELLVDNISQLFKDVKQEQSSIESSVVKIFKDIKSNNIFKFSIPSDNINDQSYLRSAKELISYIENDKLLILKEASLDKFKSTIVLIQKELGSFEEALSDIRSEVNNLRKSIKNGIKSLNVIDDIDIKFSETNSNALNTLTNLSNFYDDNNDKLLSGLFNSLGDNKSSENIKKELIDKIIKLVETLNVSKEYLELEEGFVLEFKVIEKGNDLKWRQTLDDIGSNGTSTLVKSIINISMLKMVSKNIIKNSNMVSHCILDEIGTISTDYFRELKEFVNASGFVFLNGMPTEDDLLISMYPTIYIGKSFGDYSKMIRATKISI